MPFKARKWGPCVAQPTAERGVGRDLQYLERGSWLVRRRSARPIQRGSQKFGDLWATDIPAANPISPIYKPGWEGIGVVAIWRSPLHMLEETSVAKKEPLDFENWI